MGRATNTNGSTALNRYCFLIGRVVDTSGFQVAEVRCSSQLDVKVYTASHLFAKTHVGKEVENHKMRLRADRSIRVFKHSRGSDTAFEEWLNERSEGAFMLERNDEGLQEARQALVVRMHNAELVNIRNAVLRLSNAPHDSDLTSGGWRESIGDAARSG